MLVGDLLLGTVHNFLAMTKPILFQRHDVTCLSRTWRFIGPMVLP